jgi:hypothetical protein
MRRRCIGFVRPHCSRNGWLRCESRALNGDRFCGTHRDALDGAFLGLFRKHSVFRDDKYTETQTEGDLSQNGSRSETSASFIGCDASACGGGSSPSKPAVGKRHRKKMSNTQARANWRRAATKRR